MGSGVKNRKLYYEVLRIIAIFLVIFNHQRGYSLFMESTGIKQWIYMGITMITRINVPIFFMISGALLLGKDEDYKTVFKKRVTRFVVLIFFSNLLLVLAYKMMFWMYHGMNFEYSFFDYLYATLAGTIPSSVSYWYLYAYLGLLLCLPFMQRIARGFQKQDFWVLISVHLLFCSLLPITNFLLSLLSLNAVSVSGFISIPFAMEKAFFYPLIGYYLDSKLDITSIKKKMFVCLWGLGVLTVAISCVITYYEGILTGQFTQNYVQLFDYYLAICVFITVKKVFIFDGNQNSRFATIICTVGTLTLGMYILDPCFEVLFLYVFEEVLFMHIPKIICSGLWVLLSMICGGILTYLLKKIPGINKLL